MICVNIKDSEFMKDFIFGVFCYNQENYIIENLESIKYQIVNHGKDINCSIVIGDDCSKDRTLKYIKLWLYENKNIFSHIKIIDSPSNKGVVGNYISLLKNIDTNNFKILAGDDLYYKNNIFSVLGDENIVISPMLRFHEKKVIREQRYNLKKFMVISDKQKYITNELKFNNCLESPGVFLDKRLFDEALYTELEKYKWIEDLPLFNYLFSNKKLKIGISYQPLVMYRDDVGISTNKKHVRNLEFEEERLLLEKTINVRKHNLLALRINKTKNSILKRLCKYYYDKFDADMITFNNNMAKAENEATEYLALIRKNAEDFKTRRGLK